MTRPSPAPRALTIAGLDPSGGAGLAADLKVFHQHGVDGAAVASMVTAQDRRRASRVAVLDGDLVEAQLQAVLAEGAPAAAKCGALGSAAVVEVVVAAAAGWRVPLVVDPVLRSTSGAVLLDEAGAGALAKALLPHATLVTPNLAEAAQLAGRPVLDLRGAREAARAIADLGPRAVLVTGGHLPGDPIDVLWHEGQLHDLAAERVDSRNTHGTGCALSAAITARLAHGADLGSAVELGRAWLLGALAASLVAEHGLLDYHNPV